MYETNNLFSQHHHLWDPKVDEILEYWFEFINDNTPININVMPFKKWFTGGQKIDEEITDRFESSLSDARQGKYKSWEDSTHGRLALIILFDQFSRNIYRNTPRMYENDLLALDLVKRSFEVGDENTLPLIERVFLYMPLMHAEDISIQKMSVISFEKLVEESKEKNPQNTHYYQYSLGYAQRHYAIIERFGRFPHRNAMLGRASTAEEVEFLKMPGSSF